MKVKISWTAGERTVSLDERFYPWENVFSAITNDFFHGGVLLDPEAHPTPEDYLDAQKVIPVTVKEVLE